MNSKTYLIKEKPAIFLSSSKIICKSQFLLKNDWEETKHIKRQGENICQYESLSRSCIGYHFRVQPHIMEAHLWLLGGHSCNNSYQIDNNWQNLVIYHLYEVKQRGGGPLCWRETMSAFGDITNTWIMHVPLVWEVKFPCYLHQTSVSEAEMIRKLMYYKVSFNSMYTVSCLAIQ